MADTTLSIQIQVQSQDLKRLRKEHDILVRKIRTDWRRTSSSVQNTSNRMFKGLRAGFASLGILVATKAVIGFGKSIIGAAAQMEQLRNGLKAVEGDTKSASKALKEMQEIAKLPGISLSQAINARINLRAVRVESELVNRSIREFGNALTIVGKSDELSGVVLGMTQMVSVGKVLQEEINQIASRIPQFRQAMIDAFGTGRSKDIQKMGISVETFIGKTVDELAKLERASEGANTAISNFDNALLQTKALLGDIVLPAFTNILNDFTNALTAFNDAFKNAANSPIVKIGNKIAELIGQPIGPQTFADQRRISNKDLGTEANPIVVKFPGLTTGLFTAQELQGERAALQARKELGFRPAERVRTKKGVAITPGGVSAFPRFSGIGATSTIAPGQNILLPRTISRPVLGDPDFLPQVEVRRQHELPQLIQSVPTPIPRVVPFGGDRGVFTTPVIRALQPRLQVTAESARIAEAGRLANLPRQVPIGAQPFPGAETFKKGMKDISMTTIQATSVITNAFANMAASMESSTLQIAASVLDMITRILGAVQQGGTSGIGAAFTALGLGVGAATGLGIGFAAVGGGIAIANAVQSSRTQSENTRVQTRFLRTN